MNLVRNVILQKVVLSLLMQVILLQSLAYGMQIAERTPLDISVNSELLIACIAGDSLRVMSLLEKGVEVNEKDSGGLTALHYAAIYNHNEIAKLLIKNGADINAKDKNNGFTALHYVALDNHKEMAELLIAKAADINAKDYYGMTALHCIANNGNKGIAEILIKNGADINVKNDAGMTALCTAAASGHKEIIELLIAGGAEVNANNNSGLTVLYTIACWPALGCAAMHNNKEIAELLIKNGAEVNAKDCIGQTALHCAVQAEDPETAQLLVMYNADLMAKDNQHRTPFQIANKRMRDALLASSLVRFLQKKKGMVLLTDVKLWLHDDYPIVSELQKLAEERKSLLCSTMQNKPLEASSQTPALLLQEIPLSNDEQEQAYFGEKYTREFNGLALDGEGLKAVITASMVKTLEEELKCPMYKLFDCIVGTSFGGIVALGLVASKEGDCPLLGTDDLIKFFAKYHNDMLSEKLKIKNDGDPLKQMLNALFKGSRLSDALTRVIVPCKKKHEAFDFDSKEAQKREVANSYVRDIALVTCMGMENEVTASSEYKNKAAELLFKKMEASLDDNERKKLHILYCSNAQDEGHNRVHTNLSEKLNVSEMRYCRIKAGNSEVGSFDVKELVNVYKEKGEAAAEKFLKGNESFIRKLQENRAIKDKI